MTQNLLQLNYFVKLKFKNVAGQSSTRISPRINKNHFLIDKKHVSGFDRRTS